MYPDRAELPEYRRQTNVRAYDSAGGRWAKAAPGVSGAELHGLCCDLFEGEGCRTQRIGPGDDRFEGFQFALGHGVGLEIHENPVLSMTADSTLVPGDVIAIEPGLWDRHVAGVRYEACC